MYPESSPPARNGAGTISSNIWYFLRPNIGRLAAGLGLVAVNRLAGLVAPATTKFLIDDVIIRRHLHLLWLLACAVLAAAVVQALSSLLLTQILSKSAQRVITELRCKLQEHIGRLPLPFYDAQKTGNLISRIMNDVEGLRTLVGSGLVQFVGSILTAVFGVAILLRLNVFMTFISLTLIIIYGLCSRQVFVRLKLLFRERIKTHGELVGRLTETLAGVRVVKGYRMEREEARVFAGGACRLMQQIFRALDVQAYMNLSSALLTGFVSTTIVVLGARYVFAGRMSLGSFVTYTAFTSLMVSPILQLVDSGSQFTEAAAGLERMNEVLHEMPEDDDPARHLPVGHLEGQVHFEDVSFGYAPDSTVLQNISFVAEAGTITALVGPSGAGKSTIMGLLAAFYKPVSGRVRVDHYDLAHVRLQDYRSQLGLVLQDTFLFDGTIRENVKFSNPGSSEAAIMEACRAAYVHEFAEKLPQRYETVVGERGIKLSGGQKQRLAIARALLANPRILILDEATSNLDSESEFMIQEALTRLVRGRTTFVIAHRLSTTRIADQILVLESGRIIERGKHDSLLKAGGRYFELYTRQHEIDTNLLSIKRDQKYPMNGSAARPAHNGCDLTAEPAGC